MSLPMVYDVMSATSLSIGLRDLRVSCNLCAVRFDMLQSNGVSSFSACQLELKVLYFSPQNQLASEYRTFFVLGAHLSMVGAAIHDIHFLDQGDLIRSDICSF